VYALVFNSLKNMGERIAFEIEEEGMDLIQERL
jgi:hypothetical protein